MKTRIKVVERNNGTCKYVVQTKGFAFLTPSDKIKIILAGIILFPIVLSILLLYMEHESYLTLSEARSEIDRILKENEYKKLAYLGKRTKKVSYIKYP